jgi:hypothetical protein
MNTRCYRCGRSFSIGREAVEAAAVASAGQKFHVVYCPNCRTAIKMPMDQVMRELPPGWQPPTPAAGASQEPVAEAPSAEPAAPPGPEAEAAMGAEHRSHRRHRRAKSPDAPAAVIVPVEEPAPLAESKSAQSALEAPTAELEPPAPKRTRKRKAAVAEETAPAEGANNSETAEPAVAAKKTARKRAKPKAE